MSIPKDLSDSFSKKRTILKIVQPKELVNVVRLINDCPRKSLGNRTSTEVFYFQLSSTDALYACIGSISNRKGNDVRQIVVLTKDEKRSN